jgi:hypothetical protein
MTQPEHDHDHGPMIHTCCPCGCQSSKEQDGVPRRSFLGGLALGGMALSGLSWSMLSAAEPGLPALPSRRPLVVKPVLLYRVYTRRPQTSWRPWGGVQTQQDADQEVTRIQGELNKLQQTADFPVKFLPVTATMNAKELADAEDIKTADVLLVYACDGDLNAINALGKDTIFFIRHKSGPVYLHYEIISPRFLRQHSDVLAVKGMDDHDVVIDSLDEVLWRLRALCGLYNTRGSKILAVGGPSGWATPKAPELAKNRFNLDIQTFPYEELKKLIQAAREDKAAVDLAAQRAEQYLKLPGTTLETEKSFVHNAFLLDQIFRKVMAQAGCRAMTINSCMGTIMPMSETTACLALSTLNDDGYLAFCESDFVVIPSGILLCSIAGRPPFLNDPTYPHDGIITLAHCTAPRKMDGKNIEPARIMTHFESDYGAAPKVEMHNGQKVTNILPDFKAERWVGLSAEIVAHPFMPICRSQIDIRYTCSDKLLAERMPGFHWMTVYGDYLRECAYAVKRTGIAWDLLG